MSLRQKVIKEYRQAYRELLQFLDYHFAEQEQALPEFRRYYQEQQRELKNQPLVCSDHELEKELQASDLVYVGDFHPLRGPKLNFCDLIKNGRDPNRTTLIALEDFLPFDQPALQDFIAGKIKSQTLRRRTNKTKKAGCSSLRGLEKILLLGREPGIHIEPLGTEQSSLRRKDYFFARTICRLREEFPDSQLFVFAGDLHVARSHLPQKVSKLLNYPIKDTIVFQNEEKVFWQLMASGLEHSAFEVKVSPGTYCLNHTPPPLKAIVYDNCCEYESKRITSREVLTEYVNFIRRVMGRLLALEEAEHGGLTVFTSQEPDLRKSLKEHNGKSRPLSSQDIEYLLQQAARGESCTLANHPLIYLANDGMESIAEEVAHNLNLEASYENRRLPRPSSFYTLILKEALGYFGAKLFVPHKKPLSSSELEGRAQAFLAYPPPPSESVKLSPLEADSLIHYLGYQLGEQLYQSVDQGKLSLRKISHLFRERFTEAEAQTLCLTC